MFDIYKQRASVGTGSQELQHTEHPKPDPVRAARRKQSDLAKWHWWQAQSQGACAGVGVTLVTRF